MTNEALQAIIDMYGNRICCIELDNGHKILIGYPGNTIQLSNISMTNLGGVDMFEVAQVSKSQGNKPIRFKSLHVTESIQHIMIMDPEFNEYRIDPLIFR